LRDCSYQTSSEDGKERFYDQGFRSLLGT